MANDMNRKKQLFAEMMANNMDERVERMVFTQEDLEALIQKGEKEIIICKDGIHIPLHYKDVDYFGYQKPTVVIDSDEIIDFEELGINIENCLFDEVYSQLLYDAGAVKQDDGEKKMNTEYSMKDENWDVEDETEDENRDDEYDSEEDGYEDASDFEEDDEEEELDIQEFYDDMKEYFSDYREEVREMTVSEDFDEFFDVEMYGEPSVDDGEYIYESKAKAKLACKEDLEQVVQHYKEILLSCVNEYMDHAMEFINEANNSYAEFLSDLSNAYDSCASMDCDDEAKEYVMSVKADFFTDNGIYVPKAGFSMGDVEKIVLKDLNKRFSVRELLKECDYDEEDDYYCYELNSAMDTITDIVDDFVSEMEDTLPQQIYGTCKAMVLMAINELEKKFDEIFAE